jgi:indole-3-glycerol phosphate synthase
MGFLDEILPEVLRATRSAEYLRDLPDTAPTARPGFRRAIDSAVGGFALVAEFKRVSPGAADGPRLPARGAKEFARAAAAGGARGLSCLATGPRFEGSPLDVAAVARACALPVLFKDFLVHPNQLEAARRAGASAVLLIARLESEGRLERPLAEWASAAHAAGLEVLLEFHRRAELKVAARVRADVYGVNVRDLDTLRLEPERAAETLGAMDELRPRLVLSGARTFEDARRWERLGADGLLVGTAFQRASDPARFLASLRGPSEAGA